MKLLQVLSTDASADENIVIDNALYGAIKRKFGTGSRYEITREETAIADQFINVRTKTKVREISLDKGRLKVVTTYPNYKWETLFYLVRR